MIIKFLIFYASGRLTPDEFITQGFQVLFHHLVWLLCQLLFNFNRIHFPRKITQFMENGNPPKISHNIEIRRFSISRDFSRRAVDIIHMKGRLRKQSFIVVGVIIGFGTKRDFILFSKASFLARKIKLVIWQVFYQMYNFR